MNHDIQDWIDQHKAPASELERVTADLIDRHDEWDSFHHFITWYRQDGLLVPSDITGIDPSIDPNDYPTMLTELLAESVGERLKRDPSAPPIVAVSLQVEGYMTVSGPDGEWTPEQELAQMTRTVHELPDRQEIAMAISTDIDGYCWWSKKVRDGETSSGGGPDMPELGGQFVHGLRGMTTRLPALYVSVAPLLAEMMEKTE